MDDFGLLVGRFFTALPTLTNEELSELQLDSSGRLIIAGRWLAGTDTWSEGQSGVSALAVRNDAGGPLAGIADGEYTPLQVDGQGRLLTSAEFNANFDFVYDEDSAHTTADPGAFILSIRMDDPNGTNTAILAGANGDYQGVFTNAKGELLTRDTDANTSLDNIETDIGTINTNIADITQEEDTAHVSGDKGVMPLAVRNDAGTALAADQDYIPLTTDENGNLRTATVSAPVGSEQYSVTDALAGGGDGLETITAAATPWVTVASLAHTSGTAYVYGYQWACDQNAQVRLVTDVVGVVTYYKTDINSSAKPGTSEQWCESGRIEIPGAANMEIRLQVKKRSATGGNANGTGSVHVRTA